MRLGLVTTRPLPEEDVDEELMLAGFGGAGFDVRMADWHDLHESGFDILVIRSTWDYHHHAGAFASFLRGVSVPIWNPATVCLWNLDKRYLHDLDSKGVPVVPTVFPAGDEVEVPWERFVVKPTVSGSSYLTEIFEDAGLAREFVRKLRETHEPMVQPYMASVETERERSLIWIDGEFTHAIVKEPRFAEGHESVSPAYSPSAEEREVARRAIEAAPGPLMYARVDLMRDAGGRLCVSELELIEPSLFLKQNPAALNVLVWAVRRRSESL